VGTQRPGAIVGLPHLRGCRALGGEQRWPQGQLYVQFLLRSRGGLGKRGQQRQPCREVLDRFQVGRALQRVLPGVLPVGNRLCGEPGRRIMLRQQLGLRGGALWKLRLQHLRNPLMVLLAGAPQQGLIRRLLDEGVLERVRGLRGHAALYDQFGLDQLHERTLKRCRVEWHHGLHQLIGEGAPDDRAQLRDQFCRRQAIQPRH